MAAWRETHVLSSRVGYCGGNKSRKLRGFTLVETALALGIVSFALVALLGTLPVGLQTSRAASDLTITTEIAQRLTGLIEQSGYSNCSTLMGTYYYFDDQGEPLVNGGTGAPPSALYAAFIVPATTAGTSPFVTNAVSANTLACLQINIVNDPGHQLSGSPPATVPPGLQPRCAVVPVLMANNGS